MKGTRNIYDLGYRKFNILSLLIVIPFFVLSQDTNFLTGKISFISAKNVYVKFESTKGLEVSDTLYLGKDKDVPLLVIEHKSSISCVCRPISDYNFKVGMGIFGFQLKNEINPQIVKPEENPEIVQKEPDLNDENEVNKPEAEIIEIENEPLFQEKLNGRFTVAAYSNLYNQKERSDKHRMRYSFSMNGDHLGDSRISVESNIVFRHTINEWSEVQNNLGDAFKVYRMSVSYNFSPKSKLSLGRKTNRRISGVGAIDGLQYEYNGDKVSYGAIIGSRPDLEDYGINPDLFEAGVYFGLHSKGEKSSTQSSIAFMEMRNKSNVDRRYIYLQHRTRFSRKLSLFSFAQIDLYENINDIAATTFNLTNLYFSLRYRPTRNLSFSASYDARNNVIYYESYKSFIERLIEEETRQGFRFSFNYRPLKYLRLGMSSGLRFQKDDQNKSTNINGYVGYSRIPFINSSVTARATFLKTNFIKSRVLGFRLSKDLIKGAVSSDAYVRIVKYNYLNSDTQIDQRIIGANLNWRIQKKLSLHLYMEGTFQHNKDYFRVNTKIIKRI